MCGFDIYYAAENQLLADIVTTKDGDIFITISGENLTDQQLTYLNSGKFPVQYDYQLDEYICNELNLKSGFVIGAGNYEITVKQGQFIINL